MEKYSIVDVIHRRAIEKVQEEIQAIEIFLNENSITRRLEVGSNSEKVGRNIYLVNLSLFCKNFEKVYEDRVAYWETKFTEEFMERVEQKHTGSTEDVAARIAEYKSIFEPGGGSGYKENGLDVHKSGIVSKIRQINDILFNR